MAIRNQHFVPRVYLKPWEGTVYSKKEPQKLIQGVYLFPKKDLSNGDGISRDKILCANHIYTINYKSSFIGPKVQSYFAKKIFDILSERKVSAFYNGIYLYSPKTIQKNLLQLDDWDFFYKQTGSAAPKKAIINQIKDTNCYILEEGFGTYVENNWEMDLNRFVDALNKYIIINENYVFRFINPFSPIDQRCSAIILKEEKLFIFVNPVYLAQILKMFLLMICRNPIFDCFNVFPIIEDVFLRPLFKDVEDEAGKKLAEDFIKNQRRVLWLSQIYKGLF